MTEQESQWPECRECGAAVCENCGCCQWCGACAANVGVPCEKRDPNDEK